MALFLKAIVTLCFVIAVASHAFCQPVQIKSYHDPNNTVIKEVYFVDDSSSARLCGPYKSYYISGALEKTGFYKENLPDSLWIYYNEGGGIRMKGMLKSGQSHGLWEYFYENGNMRMAGMIIDSKREGNWKYYYEDGTLKSQGDFKKDKRNGIWNYFYEEGELKAQAFYKNGCGKYTEFFSSGNVKAEGLNVDGKSDSIWFFYFDSGNLRAQGDYELGKRVGPWIFYHDNKSKSAEGSYVDGEKDGKWVHFHENGALSSEGAIRAGRKEGYWKFFDEEGAFKAEGLFDRDDGKYTEYYESGKIKAEGQIKDGKNHGLWLYYYEDGTKEGECEYVSGDGQYVGYYQDGSLKMKGKIEDGINVGIWELYGQDGSLAGYYRPYYEDNKPIYKLVESADVEDRGTYVKPAYRYKNYRSRYFYPVINEYKGVIIATNPLAMFIGQLPVSVEYYIQERIGYEFQVSVLRDPFFKNDSDVANNTLYFRGFNVSLKQKFYHPEGTLGMFYFGHEVRLTNGRHYANVPDVVIAAPSGQPETTTISSGETKFEYALIVGDRWFKFFNERKGERAVGLTLDVFAGLGFGYRRYQKNYVSNPTYDSIFDEVPKGNFSISPRLGLNFGISF
jgi:antitoxin component YwqK of YwqJK toxin-antitoxin module